jgi:hypothetical protein
MATPASLRNGFQNLRPRFHADDAMKIAHHGRIRMRAQGRAKQIICVAHVGDPVAHRLADGVFQRAAAVGDAHYFRAEHAHAEDIQPLAAHVLFTHVDHAIQTEARAAGGRGHAVLTGARFGNHALFPHALGQQGLPQRIVDLVRAGVQQVFAL